jgi:hypothetical protein
MKPAVAQQIVVEYHFRCFCGAPIVTTEKTVTCLSCGDTLGYYGSALPVRQIDRQKQLPGSSSYTAGSVGRSTSRQQVKRAVNYQMLTSVDADFEDHPGDGPHGGFILCLLPPLIVLIVLFCRSCVGG